MKIKALKIVNYKGFSDSGFVDLDDQWNVVIGQNNAGKTAFIEGIRLIENSNHPHRSDAIPRDQPLPPDSEFIAKISVGREWLKRAWMRRGGILNIPISGVNEAAHRVKIDPVNFWQGDDLSFEIKFRPSVGLGYEWPSHNLFKAERSGEYAQFSLSRDLKKITISDPLPGQNDDIPVIIHSALNSYIYAFNAKRFALGECNYQDTSILSPDANNLPAVLIKLLGNPKLFDEFQDNIKIIFPQIKAITIIPKGDKFEIRIWAIDPSTRRDDLSIPLNESGTGIGQVLAILYVAMTIEEGIVAIDEPNSFLHPGAAKKLIQVLKRYPKNQYIISTHSPDVVGAAQPAALHLIKSDGKKSHVQSLNNKEVNTKKMMLEEVGSSLSDVFSAEKVIWVEGPTEKFCFNLIADHLKKGPLIGLTFLPLRNTGDFEKSSDHRAILDIYDVLSRGGSILPVTVAFSFDKETMNQVQIDDLKRRCDGRAHVLPRRMTENYLLSPAAISKALAALNEDCPPEQIERLIKSVAHEHMPKGHNADWGSNECFEKIHAAKVLDYVFQKATENRQNYRKIRDSLEILKHILKDDQDSISELIDFVRELISTENHIMNF